MYYPTIIEGDFVKLRSVVPEDAEFILSLRLNPGLNKYLNKVSNKISAQKNWINNQIETEGDYYFMILNTNENKIGTISLYNVEKGQGEFGRWISTGNAVETTESVILIHYFGFEKLGLQLIYSKTVQENIKVLNFHKNFGATLTGEIYVNKNGFRLEKAIIEKKDFKTIKDKNYKLLNLLK